MYACRWKIYIFIETSGRTENSRGRWMVGEEWERWRIQITRASVVLIQTDLVNEALRGMRDRVVELWSRPHPWRVLSFGLILNMHSHLSCYTTHRGMRLASWWERKVCPNDAVRRDQGVREREWRNRRQCRLLVVLGFIPLSLIFIFLVASLSISAVIYTKRLKRASPLNGRKRILE